MRPIPEKHKIIIDSDPYFERCCLTGYHKSQVKIDIHHAWDYAGRQINELWAYMPIWNRKHNYNGDPDAVHRSQETKEYVQYLSLLRATPEDLAKYPKKNWQQIRIYLEKKYGKSKI